MKSGAGLPLFRRSATPGIGNRKIAKSTSPDRQIFVTGAAGTLFRCLHFIACIACITVGFRLSREALLVLVQQPNVQIFKVPPRMEAAAAATTESSDLSLRFPYESSNGDPGSSFSKSSRVHVGRHEILVRPWPHPDNVELYKAHALVGIVQREQRSLYGPKNWRPLIAITTTFDRTFQAVHLGGVLHTIREIPGSVTWIVVEAGGKSNDTSSILAQAGNIQSVHLAIKEQMPTDWDRRRQMETRLRIEGLRYVRREKLDGIIVFADDGNVHSLELFDEMQKVSWIGALSVGLLMTKGPQASHSDSKELPVQGPACNETCHVIGWHAPRASPVDVDPSFVGVTDVARHLEWAGFVLNSRAIWEAGQVEKPEWIREWDEWITGDDVGSPLRLARDQVHIEALGNCGRDVLLWWLRVEARADSRYPSRWELQSPLEVVVASKHTPWPAFVPSKHILHQKNQMPNRGDSARQKRKRRQQQQQQQQDGSRNKIDVS